MRRTSPAGFNSLYQGSVRYPALLSSSSLLLSSSFSPSSSPSLVSSPSSSSSSSLRAADRAGRGSRVDYRREGFSARGPQAEDYSREWRCPDQERSFSVSPSRPCLTTNKMAVCRRAAPVPYAAVYVCRCAAVTSSSLRHRCCCCNPCTRT